MTDDELMAAGNHAEIIARHRPRIVSCVTKSLADAAAAELIADGIMAEIFEYADQYDPEKCGLGSWITWLTVHAISGELQRRRDQLLAGQSWTVEQLHRVIESYVADWTTDELANIRSYIQIADFVAA